MFWSTWNKKKIIKKIFLVPYYIVQMGKNETERKRKKPSSLGLKTNEGKLLD